MKDAIDAIAALAEDPGAERETLEAAKDLAERLNHGDLSVSPARGLLRARGVIRRAPDLARNTPRRQLPELAGSAPLGELPGAGRQPDLVRADGGPAMATLDPWGLMRVEIQTIGVDPERDALSPAGDLDGSPVLPELVYRAGVTAPYRDGSRRVLLLW